MQTVKLRKTKISKNKLIFILIGIIPFLVFYFIFKIYPLFDMFRLSFFEYDGMFGAEKFVRFNNYADLFGGEIFWPQFKNTIFFILASTLFTIGLALVLAAVLAKSKLKGKTFFRVVLYFPNILSIVVIASLFYGIYHEQNGLLNDILKAVGLGKFSAAWLSQSVSHARASILIAMIWQAVGYYMVMYIAGMDGISDSIYESASIDGAGTALIFFKITLPLLWEIIRTTLSFFIISSINMSFLFVHTMTGENSVSATLLNGMTTFMNNSKVGMAMAEGTVLFLFSFAASLLVQRITRRKESIEF